MNSNYVNCLLNKKKTDINAMNMQNLAALAAMASNGNASGLSTLSGSGKCFNSLFVIKWFLKMKIITQSIFFLHKKKHEMENDTYETDQCIFI